MLTMPRRYKKARRYKRKSYKKKSGGMSIGDMAVAGFNMAKKIVRLINVEKKHYTTNSITQTDYNGTIIDLCDPVQGLDQDERQGDSIKPLHFTMDALAQPSSTGGATQYIRVIVFRYKDENGVTLTPSMILDPALLGTSSGIICRKNWDKKFHSKILFDKLFTLSYPAASSGNLPSVRHFKISKKLFGHINWGDSTSTEEGGGLYMLVLSNSVTAANTPQITWVSRTTYTDN